MSQENKPIKRRTVTLELEAPMKIEFENLRSIIVNGFKMKIVQEEEEVFLLKSDTVNGSKE